MKCADAELALTTVAVIVFTFFPDLRSSALILLQTVPEDVKLDELQVSTPQSESNLSDFSSFDCGYSKSFPIRSIDC